MRKINSIRSLSLAVVIIFFLASAFSYQNNFKHPFFDGLKQKVKAYAEQLKTEKIYVQTDRSFYRPGETVWFKAYLRNADDLTTNETSDVVYIEFISPKGVAVKKHDVIVKYGAATGHFELDKSLPGGVYTMKAFTNWMKNEDAFFEKEITLQKVVLPKLNMQLDYEEKAYGPGDVVTANLELAGLDKRKLSYHDVEIQVALAGSNIYKAKEKTNFDGKAALEFTLPNELKTNDAVLNIVLQYKGQTESISRSVPIVLNDIDLQFFPESGDLINGISTKMAFKAINEFGKAADIDGEIRDINNRIVASFSSFHNGMGAVDIQVIKGRGLKAYITRPKGILKAYPVPETKLKGHQINVIRQNTKELALAIKSSIVDSLFFVVQHNEDILYSKYFLTNGIENMTISTQDFPIGITRLSLFDGKKEPVAERLVFLNSNKQLDVKIKTDKERYNPREPVKMILEVKDETGKGVQGNFSISVSDDKLKSFADDKQGHILSAMLLESELKGEIEEPNFYFDKTEKDRELALDYLMMTHGWRRFEMKKILKEELQMTEFAMQKLEVSGQVIDENMMPIAGVKIISTQDDTPVFTNNNGEFLFDELMLVEEPEALTLIHPNGKTKDTYIVQKYEEGLCILLSEKTGVVSGRIMGENGIASPYVWINLLDYQHQRMAIQTDHYGEFAMHHLKAGIYQVEINYANGQVETISDLVVKANEEVFIERNLKLNQQSNEAQSLVRVVTKKLDDKFIETQDEDIQKEERIVSDNKSELDIHDDWASISDGISLDMIVVKEYKVPLIQQDNTTSGSAVTAQQIRNLPSKNINDLAATTAGLSRADDGDGLSIRGSRAGAVNYYVDGVRVQGHFLVEPEKVEVMLSGIPSAFGGGEAVAPKRKISRGKMENKNFRVEDEEEIAMFPMISYGSNSKDVGIYAPIKPEKIYSVVDQWPLFDKANVIKKQDLKTNLDLQYEAIKSYLDKYTSHIKGLEGLKTLKLYVDKKGRAHFTSVENITGQNNYQLYHALNNAVANMPSWTVAKKNKKKVATWFQLPIDFGPVLTKNSAIYFKEKTFYAPKYKSEQVVQTRTDFRSTIYWNPTVNTNEDGIAELTFWNSDEVTQFDITVEGLGSKGRIGRGEAKYYTQMPFSIDAKIPTFVSTSDELSLPIILSNNQNTVLDAKLAITVPAHFEFNGTLENKIKLRPGETKTVYLNYIIKNTKQNNVELPFKINCEAGKFKDEIKQKIKTSNHGFPQHFLYTGVELQNYFEIDIPEIVKESLEVKFTAHTSMLTDVLASLERMVRQPTGCFEQTSSANYPNLLAMNLLKSTHSKNHALIEKINGLLDKGYKRLIGFEVPGGGFDWFGNPPSHEVLTAYGLMEFVDMQKHYPVEQALIDRTAKWLIGQRDGKGSWKNSKGALHSWGGGRAIQDAYIVWAIAEAGYGSSIKKEIEKSYNDATESKDPYLMALMANTCLLTNDDRGNVLVEELKKHQEKETGEIKGKEMSVVRSKGSNLSIETTALSLMAMLRCEESDWTAIQPAVKFIGGCKNYYGYGSTQSTVLALKALVAFTEQSHVENGSGNLLIYVGREVVETIPFDPKKGQTISLSGLEKHFKKGRNGITVTFEGSDNPLPFELEVNYTTSTPNIEANEACQVSLTTKVLNPKVKMGETLRLSCNLTNKTMESLANGMAVIGFPSGLSPQPWQLKELMDQNKVDYYEMFDGKLALHFLDLAPEETKTIHLDLKTEIPGLYESPASYAYVYYDNEDIFWAKPETINVMKR